LVWAGICKAEPNKLVLLDIEKKTKGMFTKHLRNWKDIEKTLGGEGWIFRGQADATKPLKTSLERACKYFPDHLQDPRKAEILLLREFRRRFHHYSTYTPKEDDCLEWLSLMRHHGAPTRLLDFTYSFYVAVYFALEEPKNHYAIWAINSKWAANESMSNFDGGSDEYRYLDEPINKETVKFFPKIFMPKKSEKPKRFAYPLNPLGLTERLTIQKGVFMCPCDVTVSFEENLCALQGYDRKNNIIKFILTLSKEERSKALDDLYDLNITRATLFPGLDGFAKSLRLSPPKFLQPLKEDIESLKC
jgi:hypothetical protein